MKTNKQIKQMIASVTLGEWVLVDSGVKALLHQVVTNGAIKAHKSSRYNRTISLTAEQMEK